MVAPASAVKSSPAASWTAAPVDWTVTPARTVRLSPAAAVSPAMRLRNPLAVTFAATVSAPPATYLRDANGIR